MSLHIIALVYCADLPTDAELAPLRVAQTLAQDTQGTVRAVLAGPEAAQATRYANALGITHCAVLQAPGQAHPWQEHQLAECFAQALSGESFLNEGQRSVCLLAADTPMERIAGALAASMDAYPLGKVARFNGSSASRLCVTRQTYGGRLEATWACEAGAYIATVRGLSTAEPAMAGQALESQTIPVTLSPRYACDVAAVDESHAPLEGARVVVSGGRGIGSDDGFVQLFRLAESLQGAVGGSLPAVDAGWAPVARQVGQSGKFVSPEIYLAIGISGTPQHMAGIAAHTRIVAINTDPTAPIFNMAAVGAVADWKALVPALLEALDA